MIFTENNNTKPRQWAIKCRQLQDKQIATWDLEIAFVTSEDEVRFVTHLIPCSAKHLILQTFLAKVLAVQFIAHAHEWKMKSTM